MANDIIARLRLSGQQFTADTKSTFSAFNKEAIGSAAQAKSAFQSSFAEIQNMARTALQMPRTATGGLDLNVGGMRAATAAAEEQAAALRSIAVAAERAAVSAGDNSTATRLYVAAAQAAAIEAEENARGLGQQSLALERLQAELNQTAGAAARFRTASNDNVVSLGQQRASAIQLGQQFQDFSVQVLSGQSAFVAFSQQAGQAGYAMSGLKGKAGEVGKFLTGPWGIAITVAVSALGVLGGKLLAAKDALDEVKLASDGLAQAQSALGGIFDLTTGKLKSQNEMLRINARLTAINLKSEALQQRESSEKVFSYGGRASIGAALVASATGQADLITAALNKGSPQYDLIRRLRAGAITGEAAIQQADKLDFSGLKVTKTEFLQAITDSASSKLKDEMASAITSSLDSGKLDPSLKREAKDKAKKPSTAGDIAALNAAGRIRDIRDGFNDIPPAVARANDAIAELDELIAKLRLKKPPGFERLIADAEAAKPVILDSINKPFDDYVKSQRESLQVAGLLARGRDVEADAMQDILRLERQMGPLTDDRRATVMRIAEQQERAARAIEDQRRVMGIYVQAAHDFQNTFEDFLFDLESRPGKAVKGLFGTILTDFRSLQNRLLSEKLFGGLDRQIQDMLSGRTGVQKGNDFLASQTRKAGGALGDFVTALTDATFALRSPSSSGGALGSSILSTGPLKVDLSDAMADVSADIADGLKKYGFGPETDTKEIVVNAPQTIAANDNLIGALHKNTDVAISAKDAYNLFGSHLGGEVSSLLKLSPKLTKAVSDLGGNLGTMMQGAATGQFVNSLASPLLGALGLKSSKTGAQIGGAIGSVVPIPGGEIIGSVLGSVVGGLFKKTKQASSTLSISDGQALALQATGRGSNEKAQANALAGSVASGLNQIADQLGAKLTGVASVSIGYRPGHKDPAYRVDTTGQGHLTGVQAFDTEQQAVQYAISDALKDGVLTGISQASRNILAAGKDLQTSIEKAVSIEQIPKLLQQRLDPIGFATDQVNEKYAKLIDTLKEGGASAEQFAQAQQLYNLEMADAKNSTASASQTLKDFIDSLKVGSNSPYSLRDQEGTAKAALQPFLDQIAAGQSIDQGKYQDAAQAFLDIERELYGSTDKFFAALDSVQAATTQAITAIDNAAPIVTPTTDPFAEATASATQQTANSTQTIAEILAQQSQLIAQQTQALNTLVSASGRASAGLRGF